VQVTQLEFQAQTLEYVCIFKALAALPRLCYQPGSGSRRAPVATARVRPRFLRTALNYLSPWRGTFTNHPYLAMC